MSLHDFWRRIKPSKEAEPLTGRGSSEIVDFDQDGHITTNRWGLPGWQPFFLGLVIILTATLSFGLGRLSGIGERQGITVEYDQSLTSTQPQVSSMEQTASVINSLPSSPISSTEVVGSKNGTKYHYSHCPGAKQITEKNKLIFTSPSAAEASGYTLAANCKPR